MEREGGSGARPTVSIMKACEALNVTRRTIYNYISSGCVEYVRSAGGAIRIFADTLEHADRRLRESRRQERQRRNAEPPAHAAAQPAPAVAAQPAPEPRNTPADLTLFRWSGTPRLVRNMGGPARDRCPCCGTPLKEENLYDSLEPEYESEESFSCLLCGWAGYYSCRPLTRGFGSQFYVVATLRSFRTQIRRTQGVTRRLNERSDGVSLEQHLAAVATLVFRGDPFRILVDAADNDAGALLAVDIGDEYVGLLCHATADRDGIDVEAVSVLHSAHIDWDTSQLRLSVRAHAVVSGAFDAQASTRELTTTLANGRTFLEFLGVCSADQPALEELTPARRDALVTERRRHPHRYRRFLDLMSAVSDS